MGKPVVQAVRMPICWARKRSIARWKQSFSATSTPMKVPMTTMITTLIWTPSSMTPCLLYTSIVPIAGAILAFVMTLELIQLITDKNNLNDMDTWIFFKWAFKSAAAVLIVTNTWTIVMGVFDAEMCIRDRCRAGRTHRKAKSEPLSRKSGAMPPLRNWTSPYLSLIHI